MKNAFRAVAALIALGILASVSVGCVTPRPVMFKQEFVEGKSIKHIKDPVTEEYLLEICEYDDAGERLQCSRSTILVEKEEKTLL
ncbi:hypothetical protein FIV42_08445 [Persicimonas caeni]|uniref:Lipoprotein n=1 Tax=Persicimonas caeni TaxID=2292766 RepID=A0A4Y6PR08_PERCE|nr:hypothetical protein [Persicimonas caeni]QDG50758.1 hypothetical protein FIV42_08445 [Persicimonas caeni]QED31979.1 hypothetical protein FRD00_08440 [Persicimonas caeni]